jgi:hypothetical protein
MYARIATFDGEKSGDPRYEENLQQIKSQVESGQRPPGLEDARGVLILDNGETGKRLAITLFDDEESLKRGDEALNNMNPAGAGSRSSVEVFRVVVQNMR